MNSADTFKVIFHHYLHTTTTLLRLVCPQVRVLIASFLDLIATRKLMRYLPRSFILHYTLVYSTTII